MWMKFLLAGLGVAAVAFGGLIAKRTQAERARTHLVDDLRAAALSVSPLVVRTSDLTDLPVPVQRYFAHVLRDGQPAVEAVRIEQSGTFRGDATGNWSQFTATQHVTIRPPGFVWDASIRMLPLLPVRVLDAYHDGQGLLQARVGGVVTVMDAAPSPELDEGELLRYLAEAPLYPTALLPEMGVRWTPIDDHSARATLTDRETTASLVFHFNERNEVTRVEGRRAFTQDDGTSDDRPWIGYWRRYRDREGMRVPTEGEVAWIHPNVGEASYWRGRMDRLVYRMGKKNEPQSPMPGGSAGAAVSEH